MKYIVYEGEIISFEPLEQEYEKLNSVSKADKNWKTYNFALGDENGQGIINVAGNSFSSSILNMNINHLESAPDSKYIGKQNISIRKLDSFFEEHPD